MVNPLPLRNLNRQTFQQKVQELLQLLLNNPVRTLLALLLTRGLWLPILKRGGYFFLVGLGLLSQLMFFPLNSLWEDFHPTCRKLCGITWKRLWDLWLVHFLFYFDSLSGCSLRHLRALCTLSGYLTSHGPKTSAAVPAGTCEVQAKSFE